MEDTAFRAPLPPPDRPAGPKIDLPSLEKSLRRPRSFINFVLNSIATMLTLAAVVPLFSVIWMLFLRGGRRLSLAVFSSLPPVPFQTGGGFGNCIVGTLLMVGIAALSERSLRHPGGNLFGRGRARVAACTGRAVRREGPHRPAFGSGGRVRLRYDCAFDRRSFGDGRRRRAVPLDVAHRDSHRRGGDSHGAGQGPRGGHRHGEPPPRRPGTFSCPRRCRHSYRHHAGCGPRGPAKPRRC